MAKVSNINPQDIHIERMEKEKAALQADKNKLRDEVFALSAKIHAAMNIVAKADQIILDAVNWYDNYKGSIDHCPWIDTAREQVKFYNEEREVG